MGAGDWLEAWLQGWPGCSAEEKKEKKRGFETNVLDFWMLTTQFKKDCNAFSATCGSRARLWTFSRLTF